VDDPLIGTEIAGCRLEAVAGRGGMGVVYRATELRLARPVALKLIAAERAADPAFRERFEREARMAAAIEHPHVIPVYGAGEDGGHLYIVMRWVAGTDLQAVLREEGALRAERATLIADQVAQALDAAHAAGLVHRDVKPANVLLAADHVYLTDFGITREVDAATVVTDGNEWLGTVDFMSPEQLRGERTDVRSDVYALGCLLYAALAGVPPFRRATVAATIKAHLDELPPRPSLTAGAPATFDAVVARALAKDPGERFASAGALGRAALGAAAGEQLTLPVSEPPGPATTRGTVRRNRSRRRPVVLGLAALAAVAAALLALVDSGAGPRTGPLTPGEVSRAARSFAGAYGREDTRALRRLLTPGAQRVSPSDVQRGRAAVVAEYQRQFDVDTIEAYRLDGLVAIGGRAGRASGRYTVRRAGRSPITGRVALGMERIRGRPRIRLIATEPRS
jgi:serine/threonine-protein kinase